MLWEQLVTRKAAKMANIYRYMRKSYEYFAYSSLFPVIFSSFGLTTRYSLSSVPKNYFRILTPTIMARVCEITGKRYNNANKVSHSNRKSKFHQNVNLQWKWFYVPEHKAWIKLRVSTKAIKTIAKFGVLSTLKKYGHKTSIVL